MRKKLDDQEPGVAVPVTFDPSVFVRWAEQLRVDVAESVGGVLLRGARAVAIGTTDGAQNRATTAAGALVGFAFRNTDPANGATVIIRAGGPDGPGIVPVALAAGESVRDWFGPSGVGYGDGGLFVDITGAVDGAVFIRGAD